MTTYTKTWRNYLWLAWFVIQLPIIILIDGYDHLFPKSFSQPGGPLHPLAVARQDYIATFNDPIVQWSPDTPRGHDSWMGLFLYIEFAATLPTVLYAVYRLGLSKRNKGTSGADELVFLVYGFETALTTLVCFHDVFYWDDKVYSPELKNTFKYSFFAPWIVMPTLLFVDMASRILARIRVADAMLAGKKMQ
ncbi:transmembrane protein 6/97 [Rhypophila decipiens]|uniref:Efficient mitochondria targeting-associated protein 19 n=1 Tax=Rhypophila decipiens TaxID=261697 RepID=A0AAN6Y576_9PEZI|nr:transmembrane protein 6/97 [Rhypophila decipiens]